MGESEGFNRASCSAEYGGSHVGIPGTEAEPALPEEVAGLFAVPGAAEPEQPDEPSAARAVKESARKVAKLRARIAHLVAGSGPDGPPSIAGNRRSSGIVGRGSVLP